MAITVDASAFNKALEIVLLHTSRDVPEVLNSAARDVIIKAAGLTRQANASAIEKQLTTGSVHASRTKSGKFYKRGQKFIGYKPSLVVYKIINAKQKKLGQPGLNNAQMRVAARKLIAGRKSAVGFAAYAGWNNALKEVGGRGFGSNVQSGFEKSSAAKGGALPATVGNNAAIAHNNVAFIEIIGGENALQQALDDKAVSMLEYVEAKLAERCREASR